ncbi:MAG: flagellar export protein FliJ [Agarilytica sp.]
MPSESKRLSVVVDMAKREEDKAAAVLDEKRNALVAEQIRLNDLKEYYAEYDSQFKTATVVLRAEDFAKNRNFLHQLSQSCDLQNLQVEHAQLAVDTAIDEWRKIHLKLEKLRDHVKRLKMAEISYQDKQEQKRVDEWVTQTYARKDTP